MPIVGSFDPDVTPPKTYRLASLDGVELLSTSPGALGGHRRTRVYGRLDCPGALRWIAKGHYVRHRVFFADEETAIAAGYRPCARCLPDRYRSWKHAPESFCAVCQPRSSVTS